MREKLLNQEIDFGGFYVTDGFDGLNRTFIEGAIQADIMLVDKV